MILNDKQKEDQRKCITDEITTWRDEFTDGEEVVVISDEVLTDIQDVNMDEANAFYPCPLKFNFRQDNIISVEIKNPVDGQLVSLKTKFNLFSEFNLSRPPFYGFYLKQNIPQLLLKFTLPFHLSELGVKRFETEFYKIRELKLQKVCDSKINSFKIACFTEVDSSNIKLRVTLLDIFDPSLHAIQCELFFDWLAWMMLSYELPDKPNIETQAKEISAKAGEILRSVTHYPINSYDLQIGEPSKPIPGVLYLDRDSEDQITYRVYDINSNLVCGWILYSELPQNFPLQWESIGELVPFLSDILKITELHGHTVTNPLKEYLLSNPKVEKSLREYLIPPFKEIISRDIGSNLAKFWILKAQKTSSDSQASDLSLMRSM